MSRVNVLTAIRDHDLQGAGPFLVGLGFDGPGDEVVVVRGKRYDARALLGYAHGKATGDYLGPDEVTASSLRVLVDLGFTLASRADLDRPRAAPARTRSGSTSSPAPRKTASTARTRPEPVARLCSSCFTQLSVTGTCDYCE